MVLGDSQYFEGYTLFLSKHHVTELHRLAPTEKLPFFEEMILVQEACAKAFHADKMNIELLAKISVLISDVLVSIGFVVYTICWMHFDRGDGVNR